jgi:hypothetical protein
MAAAADDLSHRNLGNSVTSSGAPLKLMAAEFLNDKQTSDLMLHPRCHHDRAGLC